MQLIPSSSSGRHGWAASPIAVVAAKLRSDNCFVVAYFSQRKVYHMYIRYSFQGIYGSKRRLITSTVSVFISVVIQVES